MGARTDFIRAMLFGVVIGVAITTAFFQLRADRVPATTPTAGSASAAPPPVTIEPVKDVPLDAPSAAAESPRTRDVSERLVKLGVPVEAGTVACTSQCCTLSVDDITYDEHADNIKAALDLTPGTAWQARKAGTVRVLERCW